jgi:hypothetical protein
MELDVYSPLHFFNVFRKSFVQPHLELDQPRQLSVDLKALSFLLPML